MEHQPGMPPLNPSEARAVAEEMAKSGVPTETINAHLAAEGIAPIGTTPADEAGRRLSQLKQDRDWAAKVNSGDAEANAELARLTSLIASGRSAERTPDPSDYRFSTGYRLPQNDAESVSAFNGEAARWAADLKLAPNVASAIIDLHLDSVKRTAGMSPEQVQEYGEQQAADLHKVLGADPEARAKAASETLKRTGGREIDILRVARTSGAQVALELVLQAEALARKR